MQPGAGVSVARDRFDPEALRNPALVLPTVGILLAEGALYVGALDIALWGHFFTLLVCAFGALRIADQPLLQAFALVPLFRLVNFGMPIFVELTLPWFPLVYAPVVPAMVLVSRNDAIPAVSWRPKLAVLLAPVGIVLAGALGEIEYGIIEPDALVRTLSIPDLTLITVVMVCFVGLVEEYVYRGILQRTVQARLGRTAGILVSALFGLMHSAYQSPGELAFAAAIGLVFGLIYDATESLALVVLIHGILNVFLFAEIPLDGLPPLKVRRSASRVPTRRSTPPIPRTTPTTRASTGEGTP
jgi:membrane protease YdiL (CAAX protease family)